MNKRTAPPPPPPSLPRPAELKYLTAMIGLETKALASGVVEALVAVTGNLDDGGDIIVPGAVKAGRMPKIVWSHDLDEPVAKVTSVQEWKPLDPRLPDDLRAAGYGAIWMSMQFNLAQGDNGAPLDPESAKAYEKVKFFEDLGWSIGYTADDSSPGEAGSRLLKSITIWEASPVTHGMNKLARTMSLKSRKVYAPLKGTVEETQFQLNAAVQAWAHATYPDVEGVWASIEGTFPDSVIASVVLDSETLTVRFAYAMNAAGVALGAPEPVEITASVSPADGTIEPDDGKTIEEPLDTKVGRVFAERNASKLQAMRDMLDAMISEIADEADDDDKAAAPPVEPALVALSAKDFLGHLTAKSLV